MENIRKILGSNVRAARERAGLTQESFCEGSYMDRGFLSEIETGKTWPSPETLEALAQKLKTTISRLFLTPETIASPEEALAIVAREMRISLPKAPIFEAISRLSDAQKSILAKALDVNPSGAIDLLMVFVNKKLPKAKRSLR